MSCKSCYHYKACLRFIDAKHEQLIKCENFEYRVSTLKMLFIAMVEQDIVGGKFATGKKYQNNNGKYAVVYFDIRKWASPLIDICGAYPYNKEEALVRLEVLSNEFDKR